MMLRGEFIRGDGLVIPNNITTYGVECLLRWALQGVTPTLHMALANCAPALDLNLSNLGEPAIGTNGYARQAIAQDNVDWPTFGTLNGEAYLETKEFVFAATGGNFSVAINRIALVNSDVATSGLLVVALSNPLPADLTIGVATPVEQRTFKYRIHGR